MSRKDELMEAGIKMFAQKGYHRTKISDIVQEAGVAQGTFYLYFDSKKTLFTALLEKFLSLLMQAVSEVNVDFEQIETVADFAARIRTAVYSILSVYRDNPKLARICLREAHSLDPDFVDVWATMLEPLVEIGGTVLDQAIERGLLPPQKTKIVAYCVLGMHERIAYHWLMQDQSLDLDELVDTLTRFEMVGISGVQTPEMGRAIAGKQSQLE